MQLVRAVLQVLPRVPAVKFFRPKTYESKAAKAEVMSAIKAEVKQRRVKSSTRTRHLGKAFRTTGFMFGSAAAASSMFVLHKQIVTSETLGGGAASGGASNSAASAGIHFLAGMLGGALHATIVCPIMAKPSQPLSLSISDRLHEFPTLRDRMVAARQLYPKLLARDVVAYGGFFGMYNVVNLALEPPDDLQDAVFHPRAIARTMIAGGVAGLTYHLAAHPFDAVSADALSFKGWKLATRQSLPAIAMGSVTFAVYDTCVKIVEPD